MLQVLEAHKIRRQETNIHLRWYTISHINLHTAILREIRPNSPTYFLTSSSSHDEDTKISHHDRAVTTYSVGYLGSHDDDANKYDSDKHAH